MGVFKFKQFDIIQEDNTAKVTTDATVFAASIKIPSTVKTALEIGTGTGVLSLMLIQKFPNLSIDAIEIQKESYLTALKNFNNSKWRKSLNCLHFDFAKYKADQPYDFIFSNPPFFNNHIKSEKKHRLNIAYHTETLSFAQLANGINKNLRPDGEVQIMLPPYEMEMFCKEMESYDFKVSSTVALRHTPNTKVIRIINAFNRDVRKISNYSEVIVRDEKNNFHPSYQTLLKEYLIIF